MLKVVLKHSDSTKNTSRESAMTAIRYSSTFANTEIPSTSRSRNMSAVRSKGTKPELIVRKAAHRLGYRFRLHQKNLPGTPDLVFRKWNLVLFVNGCFWHRHNGCNRASTPKTRADFWAAKFAENILRDRKQISELQQIGWRVGIIWECQTFDLQRLDAIIEALIKDTSC